MQKEISGLQKALSKLKHEKNDKDKAVPEHKPKHKHHSKQPANNENRPVLN